MSVKLIVSYETKEELSFVIRLLNPAIKFWRRASVRKGRFSRVYIELKPVRVNEKQQNKKQ